MTWNGYDKLNLIHLDDGPWVAAEAFGLPPGIEYRIFRMDEEAGEMDMMIRHPPGYLEPRHHHESEHWQIIFEGEMHIDGQVMGPGDYVFGPRNVEHGPFYFPKGLLSFASSRGGSVLHLYDETNSD